MRNIALILSYDGSNYHGWQSQSNAVSVQDTITAAASSLFNESIKITGCGRTDTGVHAKYYVATTRTTSSVPIAKIPYALNSMLPSDIAIKNAIEVDDDFHPVHSCIEKEYTYYIYTNQLRDPFLDKTMLHYRYPVDIEKIREASMHFVGTHDFASMRSLGTPVKSTVRTIHKCDIIQNSNIISIAISANGFLYNMARTIVGTLLDVASGKTTPNDVEFILKSGDRALAGATAPAHALFMTNVVYPEKYNFQNLETE